MLQLFFGGLWPALSTVLLLFVLTYIIITALHHKKVRFWGRHILILGLAGLLLCIFAVMRDDYAASLQGGAGLIPPAFISLAYVGAGAAAAASLSSLFIKSQKYRRILFFTLAAVIVFKAALIEIYRITM